MPFSAKTVHRFRRFLLGLACCATLLAAAVVVENFRGDRAWKTTLKTYADRGDPLDVLPPAPPPVPPAQNFFQIPLLARLYYAKPDNNAEHSAFIASLPISFTQSGLNPPITLTQPLDFPTIAQSIAKQRQRMHRSEIPPVGDSPAQHVLAQLASAEPLLTELRQAALERPFSYSVPPSQPQLEDIFKANIPSFQFVRTIGQLLVLHACASLAAGDNDTAYADTLVGLQFTRGMASAPITLVETMIATVEAKLALRPLGDGLRTHAWNDAQLVRFQQILAEIHLFTALERSLRTERNGLCAMLTTRSIPGLPRSLAFLPAGWIQQNKVFYTESMSVDIAAVAANTSSSFHAKLTALNSRNSEGGTSWDFPYRGLAFMAKPALGKITQNLSHGAALITLAQTACALERHRLAHQAYPETLAELVPAYLRTVPLDVVDGQPLRYARAGDSQTFLLYSVGLDGNDDRGAPLTDEKRVDSDGDWPWPLSK